MAPPVGLYCAAEQVSKRRILIWERLLMIGGLDREPH